VDQHTARWLRDRCLPIQLCTPGSGWNVAALCFVLLTSACSALAQSDPGGGPEKLRAGPPLLRSIETRYFAGAPAIQLRPRNRTGSEMPIIDGVIRLSVQEAIVLALENNLDIEAASLLKPMAASDLQRARSGQLLRNLPAGLSGGPQSAVGALAGAGPNGYEGVGSGQGGTLSGLSVQLAGSEIPNIEPILFASGIFSHSNLPVANSIVTGTNSLLSNEEGWTVGVRKGFFTGTEFIVQVDGLRLSQNAPNNSINPSISANTSLRLEQHLLQGFGKETNRRAIRIAQNNTKMSDLRFQQQVTITVSEVLNLYYDLIAYREQAEVMRQGLKMSRQLLESNRKRLDLGLALQSDVNESERFVDNDAQALRSAEVQIAEQELTLKSVLTRRGLEDPSILTASIVPTDSFDGLSVAELRETIESVADRAVRQRGEISEAELGLTNKQFSLAGTRNALRPILDVYVRMQQNGLAGSLNPSAPASSLNGLDPSLVGGVGTVVDQLSHARFPEYAAGFRLSIPLTNNAAMADVDRDEIEQRHQEVEFQKLKSSIRLQAMKSALAFEQARSQYLASVKARELHEAAYEAEQKMFDVGTSSASRLNGALQNLHLSQIHEVTMHDTLARARVNLDAVLNETLDRNRIVIDKPHLISGSAVDIGQSKISN
jgi:outer membrane protein